MLGGGLIGGIAALEPLSAWLAFLGSGIVALSIVHLPLAAAILVTVRSSLDFLTESGLQVGPVRLNPAGATGLAVLGITAVYLLDRRLKKQDIDWGGAPAVCFGLLTFFALIGTPVGVAAVGPKMLAVGLKEVIRFASLLSLYLLLSNLLREGMSRRVLVRCLYISLIVPAGLAIYQFMYYSSEGYYSLLDQTVPRGRLTGTFYHATGFGLYLAYLLTLTITLIPQRWHGLPRWLLVGVLFFGAFLLTFTFARGAWGFLLVALAIKLLLRPGKTLIPLLLIGTVLAVSLGPRIATRMDDLTTGISLKRVVGKQDLQNSFEWRIYNWFLLLQVGSQRPILGHGAGSTSFVNPLQSVDEEGQRSMGFSAHNEFVRFFVEGGIFGVGLLCLFFFLFLRWAWRLLQRLRTRGDEWADLAGVALEVVTGLLVLGLVSGNPLDHTSAYYYFIVLFALLRWAERELVVPAARGDC